MKLGIVESIDCAHFLPGHPRCGVLHGHTYRVEATIQGQVKEGMVLDFSELKGVLRRILGEYDHRCLNDFLEYPSVENICELLKRRLEECLPFKVGLRVWEGDGKYAEIGD